MTRASLSVSLNTINVGGFEQVLLPQEVVTVIQCVYHVGGGGLVAK